MHTSSAACREIATTAAAAETTSHVALWMRYVTSSPFPYSIVFLFHVQFANQHKTALTLILVFLVLVVVLFVLVVIGSMATIFVSTSVMKQKKRSEL